MSVSEELVERLDAELTEAQSLVDEQRNTIDGLQDTIWRLENEVTDLQEQVRVLRDALTEAAGLAASIQSVASVP